MKNITMINRIYTTKILLQFLLNLCLFVSFNNLLYSQGTEYSREYNHSTQGGDMLLFPSPTATEVFYTSFKWETLDELLEGSQDSWYVKVSMADPIFNTPRFKLSLVDNNGAVVRRRNGDFPCPDECVPPLDSVRDVADNTFDVADLKAAMNRAGSTFVNVHISKRISDGRMKNTHSIYAVSGTVNNLNNIVIHIQSGEPVFTSTQRRE